MAQIVAVLLLVIWSLPGTMLADEDESWLGQKVFWRYGSQARGPHRPVRPEKISFPATVEKVQGEWLWLGRAWMPKQHVMRAAEAIEYYTAQLRRDPKDVGSWTNRGPVWQEMGELDKAISDFTEAIRLDPKHSPAHNNRGKAWHAKGDYDQAIDDYTRAIEAAPTGAIAYTNRGNAWLAKGEHDKAVADQSQAIRLDPKDATAWNNRGNVWLDKGDYDRGIRDFSAAIHRDPRDAVAYANRAACWLGKHEYDRAIGDSSAAIQIDPRYFLSHFTRGSAWAAKGEYGYAIGDFAAAAKLDPKDFESHNVLAWLLATCPADECRDGQRAIKHATEACKLTDWKNGIPIDTLAAACAEAGEFEEAVKWQQKANDMASADDKPGLLAKLDLYRQNKPFRSDPKQAPSN